MIQKNKYGQLFSLFLIYLVMLVSGLLIIKNTGFNIAQKQFATLVSVMTLITFGSYIVVKIGMRKDEKDRGIYLLAGIGGKFLAYLVMILIFWIDGKNLTKEFLIVFFVLYLVLTFFLIMVLLKILKTN